MTKQLRYGIIGAGRMAGSTMLDIMGGHPAARPVAFYEIDPARPDTAERIPRLKQAGIEACESMEQLLARRDLDVILNITPHFVHAEASIAALRAGFPVVSEKPPACSIEECQAMIEASRQTARPLLIHFQHMLRPSMRWLNQAICRGELGRIRKVSCQSLWWRNVEYYTRVAWAGKKFYQGRPALDGVMVNQSVHFLNQMLALGQRTGESHVATPKSIGAGFYRFHPAEALEMEDTVVAKGILDNEDGTEFLFAATTCAADAAGPNRLSEYFGNTESHRIMIEGEKGTATWDNGARIEIRGREPQVFNPPEGPWPFYFHVQQVLAGQEEPVTPVKHAVNTMKFVFAAYAAAGEKIVACDWNRHEEVSPVIRRCVAEWKLPCELDASGWPSA